MKGTSSKSLVLHKQKLTNVHHFVKNYEGIALQFKNNLSQCTTAKNLQAISLKASENLVQYRDKNQH